MFASPLPTAHDRPGFVVQKEGGQEALARLPTLAGPHGMQKGDLRKHPGSATLKGTHAYSIPDNISGRELSVDSDSIKLNLTLSPKVFASGVEGQQRTQNACSYTQSENIGNSIQIENTTHLHKANAPEIQASSGWSNHKYPVQELRTMEHYSYRNIGSSSIEPIFTDAPISPDEYQRRFQASNSCRVLLSDGTSYPSLIFPNGSNPLRHYCL